MVWRPSKVVPGQAFGGHVFAALMKDQTSSTAVGVGVDADALGAACSADVRVLVRLGVGRKPGFQGVRVEGRLRHLKVEACKAGSWSDMPNAPIIMMIRHAEKAEADRGGVHESGKDDAHSLAVDGWKRAGALVGLFAPMGGRALPEPRLARPAHLFAESADAPGSDPKLSKREEQTLAPMAEVLGMEPNFSFGRGHEAEVAAAAKECAGPVLIAWEHHQILTVAREIANLPEVPEKWPKSRNDMVLVFRLDAEAKTYSFEQVPQMLLPGDVADLIEV